MRCVSTFVLAVAANVVLLHGFPVAGSSADETAAAFVAQLHRATANNNRQSVSRMIAYPLTVLASGLTIPVPDRAAFLKYYDVFFTEEVQEAIARAAGIRSGARVGTGWSVLGDGLTIGSRILYAKRTSEGFKVVRIALPSLNRGWRAARAGSQRIRFRAGEPPARFSGALARNERESYVLTLHRGELLSIRIDEVRRHDVVAHVVSAHSKEPVDSRASHGVRVWAGRVAAAGDYEIIVVRVAKGAPPVLTYLLTVDVR